MTVLITAINRRRNGPIYERSCFLLYYTRWYNNTVLFTILSHSDLRHMRYNIVPGCEYVGKWIRKIPVTKDVSVRHNSEHFRRKRQHNIQLRACAYTQNITNNIEAIIIILKNSIII